MIPSALTLNLALRRKNILQMLEVAWHLLWSKAELGSAVLEGGSEVSGIFYKHSLCMD